ncbi:chemotaxis protein CheA [Colwellia psychrerythraea]|uniref:Chemotaxis protein CheA n=1 Tax=Colwellia psychrerythraea TaxID=28229 RepID=A0A099KBH5_COLPS|nr:chemotaxis protein CheA [Colwellia psychrerythraea]KGJ87681.1 CheA signal transduction histidine kinase [Colwellia psychrerythraea]
MSVDLSQFIPSFLEESFEGLELMESGLLDLQRGDNETIHSIFRAAHSIKGGAGTFGFDNVTEFTHLVETLLDEMRDGRREVSSKDTEILLESVDCMRLLIEAARDDEEYDQVKVAQTSKRLSETLGNEPTSVDESLIKVDVEATNICGYTINFIPEHSLAKTGNDPIFLFSALAELGQLTLCADTQDLPALTDIDAQELYLSWQLTLHTEASKAEIIEIFEWVEDECLLELVPIKAPSNTSASLSSTTSSSTIKNDEQQTEPETSQKSIQDIEVQPPETELVIEPTIEDENIISKTKTKTKGKAEVGSIRVGVDKVDSLINLVGELVITQSMLSELGNDFEMEKVERLTSGLEQLLQNTKELQESVMRIRMLPISFAFNRFPRLVHDLAIKTGKEMELVIKGEQTELDKTVMEQIGDPLVHLVRNAADHGIEQSAVRLANGKPGKGTISLDAYHQGGNIVIEINDDGAGINREIVLAKAVEKGLVDANAVLTDSQVYDLLFEPGFSTAAEVTDISGRGVGMDVVKRNIQALGGRIQVQSTLGKGSSFKVHLPLTLAILDGQLVKVGTETYIIPLIAIVESLQIDNKLINRVSGDMVLYRLRDDNVPILPIYQLFNLATECTEIDNALLVVVEADGQKIGLMVDDLLAQQQVVIKSLKDNYQQVAGISGATILGDGSVAMILDIPGIIHMALEQAQQAQRVKTDGNSSVTAEVCL